MKYRLFNVVNGCTIIDEMLIENLLKNLWFYSMIVQTKNNG